MKALIPLILWLFSCGTAFSQSVVLNMDEQTIGQVVERGLQQLERAVAKINLNVDININTSSDQINLDGPQQSKIFSKSYPAGIGDKLVLGNQYGSMQIKTWEKKEVKVDVNIRAYANSEEEARKLLAGVNIESGKQADQIIFKTKLDQGNGNWGSGNRNGRRWRREVKVDYVVYMPASTDLTLAQNYGNVSLQDLSGSLYAKVQYGNFAATELKSGNNYISVQYGKTDIQQVNRAVIKQQYGSGLTIGTVGTLDLDAQYAAVTINAIRGKALIKQQYGSGLTIGVTDQLDLDIQYASATVNTVKGNAKINQQYSNLNIGNVGNLDLKAEYTSATIGKLRGNANINMEYNRLNIGEVGSQCRSLDIDGDYLSISLGFAPGLQADFEVNTSYAAFKYGENVSAKLLGDKNASTKNYTGKISNGGETMVKVKSNYGSVLFK